MATSKKSFTQQQIAKQVAKDQKKNNTQSTASSGQKAASAKSGSSSVSAKTYTGLTQERYNQLRNKGYTKEQINQAYNSKPQMTQDLYNRLRRQGYTQKQIEKGQYDREMFIPWHTQDTADKSFNSWGKDIEDFTSWSNKSAGDISKWDTSKAKTYSDLFQKNAYSARNYMLQLDRLGASKDTEEYKAYQDYYNYFTRAARQISSNNNSYLDYRKNNMYDAGGGVYYSYDQAKQIEQQLRDEADRMKNTPKNVTITPVGGFIDTQSKINEKRIPDMLKRADAIRDWITEQDKNKDEADWYVTNLGRGQDSAQVYQNAAARMADVESQMNDLLSRRPDYYSYGQSDELGNVYAYDDAAYNQAKTAWDAEYDKFRQEVYLPAKRDYDYAQGYQFNSTIQRANTGDKSILESIERGKAIADERQAAIKQAQDEALAVAGQLGAATQSGMASATMYYRAGAKERRAADPSTWSEEKLNAYHLLLDEGRTEEADRLAMLTNDAVQKARDYEQILKPLGKFQDAHPGWGGVASFAAGTVTPLVFGLPEYFANLTEYAVTGEISNANVTPTQISNSMVSKTADQLNKRYGTIDDSTPVVGGKGVGDLYQVAISVAQSALSLATGRFVAGGMGLSVGTEAYKNAVQAVTLTQFFGSAASSGIYDALEDGLDPGQAILLGTFNGMAEVAGEVLSVENLINIGDAKTMRNLLRDVFTQAGIEASEEAFTTLLNTMADTIVKGDKNDLQTAINSYISQGMDPTSAEKQAIKDWLNGMGQDALSGFLSGGFSSVIQTGRANIGTYKQNVTYLNDLASQTADGSRSREMAEKYGSRERLSKFRGNQYAEQVKQDLISNNTDTAVRAIEQRLTELGETGNVHQKAQDIANAVVGAMTDEETGGWSMRPSDQISATATANMRQVVDELATAREQYVDYSKPDSSWTDPIMKGRFLDQRILSGNKAYNALYNAERKAENTLKEHTTQVTDLSEQILEAKKELGRLSPTDSGRRTELNNKIREAEKELKSHQDAILSDGRNVFTEEQKAASVEIDGKEYKVSGLTMADGQTQAKLTDADGNTMNVSIEDERLPAEFRNLALKVNTLGWAASMAFEHYKTGTDVRNYIYRVQAIQAFASEKISRDAFMNSSAVKALNDQVLAEFLYSHGQELYNERQAKVKKAAEKLNEKAQKAMEKTGDIDNVRTKGKGKVDTKSGWTMPDGTHYAGIQGKKLSAKQNAVVRMIDYISDALNLDYIIFDGDAKGIQGVYHDGGTIAININAGLAKLTPRVLAAETLSHELTHFEDEFAPEEFDILREAVVTAAYNNNPDLFEQRVQAQMRMLGPNFQGDRHEQAIKELVAEACTTMLQNSKVVTEIARQNMTVAQKMADFIEQTINKIKQAIADAFADSDPSSYRKEVALIEKDMDRIQKLWDAALEKAVFNYNASKTIEEITQDVKEGKAIDPVSEVQFSRYYDEEYMDKAIALNDTTRFVSDENMQSAKRIRQMVQQKLNDPKLADKLKLPEDIVGNTFLSNSSYGGSEENTTICVRSLAAQALMDEIAKSIGAPLTVEDTLVISQEMMTWLNKPECIYCYVATDRRAYRQFLGDYIKQRDAALKSIADVTDRQTAYKEFLDGRKNTKEMRNRFKMWQDYAASGELIQPSDLASIEELFSEIDTLAQNPNRTEAEEAKFLQLKDAAKYAQSASWAKKMMGYTAYDNHILKWKQDRIDEFNKHYGLRMYSFSDYSPAFVLENMQMVTDAAVKGLKMLAYTKEIEFAKVFAPSGMNINVSVFASQDPNNGRIMEDEMMGAKWKEAIELREQYPNVGITLVATNDALVEWGLNNPNVDVVIPYHLVRTGQEVVDYFNNVNPGSFKNYTSVSADGKIKGVKYGKGAQKSVYPSEHQNDLIKYVNRLQELQLTPRFESYLKGYEQYLAGTITEQEFRDLNPTYMKLVNETRQSAEQTGTVQPIFDQQAALDSIDTLIKEGGYNKSVLEHLSNNPDMAESILEEITDTVREKRAEREARRGMQFQAFNSEEEIDAEIDRLQDQLRDIQNAQWQARDRAKSDPRVQEAQELMWKAEDEKGRSGSIRERVEYKRILKQVSEELASEIPEGDINELANRINELKQQKENFHKNIEITDADYEKLVDNFGTTNDPSVAGFILKDGRMLDFSGKKQYGNQWAGGRDIYHSEVADVISIPSSYSPRVEMVSNGNIRLVPEINGINLSARPTSKQRSALRDFIDYYNGNVHIDIDNLSGRTLESFAYHSGTSASKILADIDNYFKTGQTPAPQSNLAQFRDQYQTAEEWEEGPIYNKRALVSEQTLDRWLDAYAARNPNYAQAYITYMNPDDFLNLTTTSRASRAIIEDQSAGFTPEQVVKASKGQPIFLDIDTETGEVTGHEGRHRMVALKHAGIDRVPVLLFDYSTKYSKTPMDELVLTGQTFNGKPNLANATVRDLLPLSNGNKAAIAEKYGTKTSTERLSEKYSGRQTLQFQMADQEYMDAVNSGNTEEQQRMVDEAARATGYTIRAYHGSPHTDISVFDINRAGENTGVYGDRAMWFTDSESFADEMSYQQLEGSSAFRSRRGSKGKVYDTYLKINRPFDIRNMTPAMRDLLWEMNLSKLRSMGMEPEQSSMGNRDYFFESIDAALEAGNDQYVKFYVDYSMLRDAGYDGIIARLFTNFRNDDSVEYGVFSPEQIKSADPITYDGQGNVIPLSQRFNANNPQIQYQMYDNSAQDSMFEAEERQKAWNDLQAENAVLEDTVTQLRKEIAKLTKETAQLRKTDKPEVRMNDARKMARQIIKDTRPEPITTRDKAENRELTNRLSQQIKEIGDYILETGKNPNEMDYSTLRSMAQEIADDIVSNAEVEIDDGGATKDMRDQMRSALRRRAIFVPEQYRSDVLDWNDFKKRYRNVFSFKDNGTDIDIVYQSLLEEIPGLLDPNINNPGDMLNELADKWDLLQPKYENPFDDFTNEAVNHYTNMILQGALDGTLREIEPTYADRMNERINRIRADRDAKVAAAENLGRERISKLRDEKNARIEEIYKQGIARKQEALAREREAKWAKVEAAEQLGRERLRNLRNYKNERIADTRKYYQDMRERATIRRKNSETRTKVKKLIADLNSRLTHPTERKYVPADLVNNTIKILEMIDLDTGKESVRVQERIALLQQQYAALNGDQTFAGYAYDPVMEDAITNMARQIGNTPLRKMSSTQLDTVYNTLRMLEHTIRTAVKDNLYGEEWNFYEAAKAAVKATKDNAGTRNNALGNAADWYTTNTMRPQVVFERFGGFAKGSEWEQIYDMLDKAQRYGMDLQMKFAKPFEELLKDKKELAKLTSSKESDLLDIGLKDENGETIKVPRDFMLFVYMNLFNEDNIQHVMRGGIECPELKEYNSGKGDRGYGKGSRRAVGISPRLSDINHAIEESTDANEKAALLEEKENLLKEGMEYINTLRENIEKKLTDYDKKWVQAWWQFERMSSEVLNDTSMQVYGFKKFIVEQYFPIITDRNFLNVPMDTIIKDMSLENAGFTKERIHASTPIKMMGLSDVINMQANRTAQYAAMMPAIRAFNKIYNKTMPGYSTSVKDALNKKFGDSATKFVENLMADLQGGRRADFTIFDRLRGRMAQATLSLNPRVALAQTASFPTAAAELGWKPVLKALARGGKNNMPISAADRELIAKWSSALWYRSKGGTVELGDVKNMQQASHKVMDKLGWAMNWIEFMDSATVGRLWYAAQYYVDDNFKALQKGSDAYYEKVAEAFNRTIENTQPNYTTLQRPELLRNPDALVRQISMFMTQRLQNQSILYGAAAKYLKYRADYQAGKNGVTQEDLREMRLKAVNAATSQVAAAACITVFKFLADMLLHRANAYRRKEDKTLDAESISLAMLNNFAESLVSNMWLGSELYSAAKSMITKETYYGMELSGVSTLTETVENIVKFGQKPSLSMAKKLGESLSQFLGIPAANAEKIGQAVWYWMQDAMNGEFMEAGVERTDAMNAKLLTEAYSSGDKQAIEKYSGTFEDDDDMLDSVRSYIKTGYVSKDKQTISKPEAIKLLVQAGMRQKDAEAKVQEWTCELVTGIPFSKIKEEYMAGNITQARVTELLQKYGGRDKETAERTARSYACEKDTGHPYTDLKEAYILGEVSKNVLEKAVKKYGGMNAEDTQKKLYYYDYLKENPTSDISENRAVAYMTKLKPAGIRAKDYEDILNRADADKNGSYSQAEVGSWLTEKGYNAKQAEALWSAMGPTWKTGFDAWQVKYNADMQATGKGSKNGNVSQRELGPYLVQQINAGKITMEQAEGYWKTFFSKSTTTFKKWLKKNHYKIS